MRVCVQKAALQRHFGIEPGRVVFCSYALLDDRIRDAKRPVVSRIVRFVMTSTGWLRKAPFLLHCLSH